MNLLDIILSNQNGNQIQQLAKNFGISDTQAKAAVVQMVPSLTQGMRKNISSESGFGSLMQALQNGNHQKYVDQADTLADGQAVIDGNGILGHILGGKDQSRALAAQASAQTGLDSGILKKMLPVVASVMMGSLNKQAASSGMLGNQAPSASSGMMGMLSGLLDADKDGSVVDDLAGMASKLFR